MLTNFFKSTFRSLWKNKTYSFLNIFGLAVGIACAGLIFLWVEDEVTFDNTQIKKDRLYALRINASYAGNAFTNASTPRLMADAIKAEVPGIANACRTSDQNQKALFSFDNKFVYAEGTFADASLFTMFTLPFAQGSAQSAFKQLYSIVITEKAAKKFFGDDKNVIGKTVKMNNKDNLVVSGVLKDLPGNFSLQFEWVAPMQIAFINKQYLGEWNSYGPLTYVELNASANLNTVNSQLYNYIHHKDGSQTTHAFLFPMSNWRLYDEFANGKQTGGGRIEQVRMLAIIAWIILFIACINFMNLSTARNEKYSKEVGVRKVLGSSRKRLVSRFMGEALCMAGMATVTAVLIIFILLPAFNMLMQKQLLLNPGSPVHIAALFAVALICGLIAGSYPSLYLSSFNPIIVLKGLKVKAGSAAFIRKGLVVLQFTVSVVFIISSIIIYLQIQHVRNRKLGFNKDSLIEVDMQTDFANIFPSVKQHLLSTGVVENAAASNHAMIYDGDTDDRFTWQGKPANSDVSVAFRSVSPEFVSTYGLHIIAGKDFNEAAGVENAGNVIINQSLAKIIGKGDVVGKIIQSPRGQENGESENLTIVGVVDDYMYGNMYERPGPVMLFCKPPRWGNLMYVRIKPQAAPEDALAKIEAVLKKDNPAYPFQYKFIDDQFNDLFNYEILMSKVSGIFAGLAIIISCLGLFGLAAYTAERRLKEIGIRKVLGASVTGITTLLSRDFLLLVGISCLISFPVADWIMHNWLQTYEYRIGLSWWIFAIAGLSAALIALITISVQTIKAALANPVTSLRSE